MRKIFEPESLNDFNMALTTYADVKITVNGEAHEGKVVSVGPGSSKKKELHIKLEKDGVSTPYVVPCSRFEY